MKRLLELVNWFTGFYIFQLNYEIKFLEKHLTSPSMIKAMADALPKKVEHRRMCQSKAVDAERHGQQVERPRSLYLLLKAQNVAE